MFMPQPRSLYNLIKTWIIRLPVENLPRFIRASDKDRGIAGASFRLNNLYGFAGDSLCRTDYVFYGKTFSITKIKSI